MGENVGKYDAEQGQRPELSFNLKFCRGSPVSYGMAALLSLGHRWVSLCSISRSCPSAVTEPTLNTCLIKQVFDFRFGAYFESIV